MTKKYICPECGNDTYFVVDRNKVICDICLDYGKTIIAKEVTKTIKEDDLIRFVNKTFKDDEPYTGKIIKMEIRGFLRKVKP